MSVNFIKNWLDEKVLQEQTAQTILELILIHANYQNNCEVLNPVHLNKIKQFVANSDPIHMVLPAFPAKSPNPEKTSGPIPDMAEVIALNQLNQLCETIKEIYAPGAKITVCSDGRVFSDLVMVEDYEVSKYARHMENIIRKFSFTNISLYNLEDVFNEQNFDQMRKTLVEEYALSTDEIRAKIKTNETEKLLFNGIHRFILEDQKVLNKSLTKNQLSKYSKKIAYQVIQRSNAWSSLMEQHFPNSLRLSIHPQLKNSHKLAFCLVKSNNCWRTPWHSVALKKDSGFTLVPKKEALALGATLQYFRSTYSYYSLVQL